MDMPLKPQDLFIIFKLITLEPGQASTYNGLAHALHMSPSRIHAGIRRAMASGLVDSNRRPRRSPLKEFVLQGAPYAFYTKLGPVTRGLVTAHAAPPLSADIVGSGLPPVWPDSEGATRGETIEPLHKSVPKVAREDDRMYELLALFDALRVGRSRERKLARSYLEQKL
jgi:hypothetical protein